MFTGIIEETGAIAARTPTGDGQILRVSCERVLEGVQHGASIAVCGVCVTVADFDDGGFSCDLSRETLDKSTLGRLQEGARVNLERAMRIDGRLDGHFVQGHVDGIATIEHIERQGKGAIISCLAPRELRRYIAPKGSVTLDGVSLTVAGIDGGTLSVAVIPSTWEMTIMPMYQVGSEVNLETDMLARYIDRLLESRRKEDDMTLDKLMEEGFV
jgi:riboflavin synthase